MKQHGLRGRPAEARWPALHRNAARGRTLEDWTTGRLEDWRTGGSDMENYCAGLELELELELVPARRCRIPLQL